MELDLDQARRRAKELLRAARAGDADALARMRDDRAPRLADAQRAVAADLGFASWPALVAHVEGDGGDRPERRARLVHAALEGRDDVAERLLAEDAGLAGDDLEVALVLGDESAVAAALDRDPALVSRDLPVAGASRSRTPATPRSCGRRRRARRGAARGASCCSIAVPTSTRCITTSTARCPCCTARRASRTTSRRRGCCSTAARTRTTASPSTTRSRRTNDCLELLLERGATVRDTNALGNAIESAGEGARAARARRPAPVGSGAARRAPARARPGGRRAADRARRGAGRPRPRRADAVLRAARFRERRMMRLLEAAGAGTELDPAAEWIGAIVRGDGSAPHAARGAPGPGAAR